MNFSSELLWFIYFNRTNNKFNFMVLETKICRSACCEAGLFVEMKRNTRLL